MTADGDPHGKSSAGIRLSGWSGRAAASAGEGTSSSVALDELDRMLLGVIQADPAGSFVAWAERLGISDRTVTRRYRELRDAGVLRVRGRTLPGFEGRIAWMTRTGGSPEEIDRLAGVVARFPHSRWVRISRDGTELTAGLVTEPGADDAVLRGLTKRGSGSRTRVHQLLRVWGAPQAVTRSPRPLDAVDEALLRALARDGRSTLVELARQTGLDATTVGRRRARLIEEGVLYFEADVDPGACAEDGDVLLWLAMAPGQVRELAADLVRLPQVRFVAATSGDVSLVVNVAVAADADLPTFVDERLAGRGVLGVEIAPQGRLLKRAPAGWA